MRLAVILFGLSYFKNYKNKNLNGKEISIDYKNSIQNYQKNIFDYFKNKGYEIDIFFCTNKSIKKAEIINFYNPKSYLFTDNFYSNSKYGYRNYKVFKSVDLCLTYSKEKNIKYDHVLLTRFDLKFKENFNKININFNKFNCSFMLNKKTKYKLCDNFYFFPFEMINNFYKILKNSKRISSHNIYPFLLKKIKYLNFIFENQNSISKNNFYKFVRNKKIL